MIQYIKRFFQKKSKPKTDFSKFFLSASEDEQKALYTKVLRAANQEQREIVERYDQLQAERA
jgi:hypothetical protein